LRVLFAITFSSRVECDWDGPEFISGRSDALRVFFMIFVLFIMIGIMCFARIGMPIVNNNKIALGEIGKGSRFALNFGIPLLILYFNAECDPLRGNLFLREFRALGVSAFVAISSQSNVTRVQACESADIRYFAASF